MKKVYICSPYREYTDEQGRHLEVDDNVENAINYSKLAVKNGCMPVCPHIYFTQFLDDNDNSQRNCGRTVGIEWLENCHELWVFGDYISEGMTKEIEFANEWDIPIVKGDEFYE
ncbi:hypothetical protein FACS1894132_04690 [Clostridia bacterium]|nr:hypothetical protein FACS1894132_04690 [Clostridia bacterium]